MESASTADGAASRSRCGGGGAEGPAGGGRGSPKREKPDFSVYEVNGLTRDETKNISGRRAAFRFNLVG